MIILYSPGTRPSRLSRDEGELVVGEGSQGGNQGQRCLSQIIKISALHHRIFQMESSLNQKRSIVNYLACTGQATESLGRERAREHCKDNC